MQNICMMFIMFSSDVCKDIRVIKEMPENFDLKYYYSSILTF